MAHRFYMVINNATFSKRWEIIFLKDYFFLFSALPLIFCAPSSLFSLIISFFLLGLRSKAKNFSIGVIAKANFIFQIFAGNVGLLPLSLIFFGLQDSELLLLDPVSVNFPFLDWLPLGFKPCHINSFFSIVFIESFGLRLLRFLLLRFLSLWIFSLLLAFLFYIFVFVELILQISDVSSAAAFLARSIITASPASSVKVMSSGGNLFGGNDFMISLISGIVLDLFRDVLIGRGCLRALGVSFGLLDFLLFGGFPFLVCYVR